MSDVTGLILRTERLRNQAQRLSHDLDELRQDLLQLKSEVKEPRPPLATDDCFAAAQELVQDLGPDVSSEHPHGMAGRGVDWFGEP
ncbi:MAG: hypothetical protein WD069_22410 [Planctomycetales bacterium]